MIFRNERSKRRPPPLSSLNLSKNRPIPRRILLPFPPIQFSTPWNALDTRPQSGIPFLLAVSLKNRGRGKSERGKDRETFHGFIATHSTSNYSSCELACNLAGNTTPGNPGVLHPPPPPLESARVPRSSSAASRLCGIVDDHRGGPKSASSSGRSSQFETR